MNNGLFTYLAALLLFGSNGIIAAAIALPSSDIVLLRTFLGALSLVTILAITQRHKLQAPSRPREAAALILSGAALGASWIFLFRAYQTIGVGVSSLLYYCGPIIVMALSPFIFGEKLTGGKIAGFIAVACGAFLIAAQGLGGNIPIAGIEDQQEALCIHSVLGENIDGLLAGHRPFRSPHHSISTAGLIGGGRPVHPGEISLAHGGVLFLDELAEFPTGVLQTLRQPIERGYVRIVRVDGAFTFPSRFQLLAASNPCPCGFLGDREVPCRCSASMVERYRSKLRVPLADRIDLMIDVTRPDPQVIIEGAEGMSSAELRDYVVRGRAFRAWRESRMDDADAEAEAEDAESRSIDGVVSTFALDQAAETCVLGLSKRTHLTGRGIVRLVRIARTIADVAESERVTQDHVLEAAMYQGRRDQ